MEKANGSTVIKGCGCASAYQDQRYGAGRRVHNVGGGDSGATYSCTVCGTTKG